MVCQCTSPCRVATMQSSSGLYNLPVTCLGSNEALAEQEQERICHDELAIVS